MWICSAAFSRAKSPALLPYAEMMDSGAPEEACQPIDIMRENNDVIDAYVKKHYA
jgi:hypothetical protein